jgi:hypothetical protein
MKNNQKLSIEATLKWILLSLCISKVNGGSINSGLSFLRMQESQEQPKKEIPAYAGMTIFRTPLKSNFLLIILILITNISSMYSQIIDKQNYYFGIGFQHDFDFDNTNFRGINAVQSCCLDNLSGEGTVDNFNLSFIYKGNDYQNFGINFGYNSSKSNIYSYEKEVINVNGNIYNGEFKHNLDIDYFSYNLGLFYPYLLEENIFISLGCDIINLTDINYNQKEEITLPFDRGVFQDTQTRTRNEFSGKLNNINNIQFQFNSSIEYLLPLNRKKSLFLAPHVVLTYRFSELIKQSDWTKFGYGIGLSLRFRFEK